MAWNALGRDLRGGLRLLGRRPGFAVVAVLSLTLGIGVNTTVFTLIHAVFLRPVPIEQPSRAVFVYMRDQRNSGLGYLPSSYINLRDYQQGNSVFSAMSVIINTGTSWMSHGHPEPLFTPLVNADFFQVLGEKMAAGRSFLPEEDTTPGGHAVAVVSYSLAQRSLGGAAAAVGQQLNLNGTEFTVVGVAPADFQRVGPMGSPDAWLPVAMHDQVLTGTVKDWFNQRRPAFALGVARLKPGVSLHQAEEAMSAMAAHLAQTFPTDDAGRGVALVPVSESNVPPNQRGLFLLAGALIGAIAGLVLLIACANVANLLLVRAAERRREIAVRMALGAKRAQLVQQQLTESLVLALVAGICAVGFAWVAKDALWALRPAGLDNGMQLAISLPVLGFTLAAAVVATALFGLLPALRATRQAPIEGLGGGRADAPAGGLHWYSLRGLLVAAQVAFSLVALIVAGLFLHSMVNAQHASTGFDTAHLVTIAPGLQAARYPQTRADQFYKDAVARLAALPQVAAVSYTDTLPFQGGMARTTFPAGVDTTDTRNGKLTPVTAVAPGYFKTMDIPILRGRDFTDSDGPSAPMVAIINQALAQRLWPGQNPLGKGLRFLQESWEVTVVGEVPTVTYASVGETPQAQVYFPFAQHEAPATIVVRTVGDPQAALANLQSVVHGLDRSLPPPRSTTVQQQLDQALAAPRMGAELLAAFGALALLLAAIGTYGVMAYSVTQRRRELGIRMALGATGGDLMRLVFASGLAMVGAGIVAGVVLAALLGRTLGSLLYGVGGFDLVSMAAATLVLLAAAVVACWLPARRAMGVAPNQVLQDS